MATSVEIMGGCWERVTNDTTEGEETVVLRRRILDLLNDHPALVLCVHHDKKSSLIEDLGSRDDAHDGVARNPGEEDGLWSEIMVATLDAAIPSVWKRTAVVLPATSGSVHGFTIEQLANGTSPELACLRALTRGLLQNWPAAEIYRPVADTGRKLLLEDDSGWTAQDERRDCNDLIQTRAATIVRRGLQDLHHATLESLSSRFELAANAIHKAGALFPPERGGSPQYPDLLHGLRKAFMDHISQHIGEVLSDIGTPIASASIDQLQRLEQALQQASETCRSLGCSLAMASQARGSVDSTAVHPEGENGHTAERLAVLLGAWAGLRSLMQSPLLMTEAQMTASFVDKLDALWASLEGGQTCIFKECIAATSQNRLLERVEAVIVQTAELARRMGHAISLIIKRTPTSDAVRNAKILKAFVDAIQRNAILSSSFADAVPAMAQDVVSGVSAELHSMEQELQRLNMDPPRVPHVHPLVGSFLRGRAAQQKARTLISLLEPLCPFTPQAAASMSEAQEFIKRCGADEAQKWREWCKANAKLRVETSLLHPLMIHGYREVDGTCVTVQEPTVALLPGLDLLEVAHQARCCGLVIPQAVTGLAQAMPRLMRLQAAAQALVHHTAQLSNGLSGPERRALAPARAKLDSALAPGFSRVNWASLQAETFLQQCRRVLGTYGAAVSQAKQTVARMRLLFRALPRTFVEESRKAFCHAPVDLVGLGVALQNLGIVTRQQAVSCEADLRDLLLHLETSILGTATGCAPELGWTYKFWEFRLHRAVTKAVIRMLRAVFGTLENGPALLRVSIRLSLIQGPSPASPEVCLEPDVSKAVDVIKEAVRELCSVGKSIQRWKPETCLQLSTADSETLVLTHHEDLIHDPQLTAFCGNFGQRLYETHLLAKRVRDAWSKWIFDAFSLISKSQPHRTNAAEPEISSSRALLVKAFHLIPTRLEGDLFHFDASTLCNQLFMQCAMQ